MNHDVDTSRISPTAHYTAQVWYRNGMSHPALTSRLGRLTHAAVAPLNSAYGLLTGRPNLEMELLARHRILDHLLELEIAAGRVRHVVEIAAGQSPRGFQFARRFPQLTYIEGDLPEAAARKLRLLDGAGLRGPNHTVVPLNALVDDGATSIGTICAGLPPGPTAIITEGLLNYFDTETVRGMWRRIARALSPRHGIYLSDLHLGQSASLAARLFSRALAVFARGNVFMHFTDAASAEAELRDAGFGAARVQSPAEFHKVDVPRRFKHHEVSLVSARMS